MQNASALLHRTLVVIFHGIIPIVVGMELIKVNQELKIATAVSCVPDLLSDSGIHGKCIPLHSIEACGINTLSASRDCSGFGNGSEWLCCYDSTVSKRNTNKGNGIETITSPYHGAALALTVHQQCGIPNGDPAIFNNFEKVSSKIVGGLQAPNGSGSICWQDKRTGTINLCGGSIVGRRTIITAAHCLVNEITVSQFDQSNYDIIVAIGVISRNRANSSLPLYPDFVSNCAQTVDVLLAIPHPSFTQATNDNDIAVLVLAQPIDFRSQSACACRLCLNDVLVPQPGDTCATSGFGRTSASSAGLAVIPLYYVAQPVRDPAIERCFLARDPATGAITNTSTTICAGGVVGQDACIGDSGGPLFCFDKSTNTQYLAGVVSAGSAQCAVGVGSLYTKVQAYLPWIFDTAPLGDLAIIET
ncbi:chymotrypsin-like protease CTRL-1 [Paramacrobiotus metropolitanus]|uniref:chymotrypsin-like protease CTRL-1 n=1 Tax=Paramacrobiotus metropolitanus TaxID=2943436 RepID=UPI00244625F3|nr:chymotrypsin-like protease CTRL-1 [Paramacrobiotus metropolitanus]